MKDTTFEKDMSRYSGAEKRRMRSFHYWLRKTQSVENFLMKKICRRMLLRACRRDYMEISDQTRIGPGFYVGHPVGITINPRAVIGKNVNIHKGVTIGQENRGPRKGVPKIGDDVWIGINAMIVGNVTIGDDVLIAPLSFVNFDVPDHSVVVGNPARIIHKENATQGYISCRV